MTRGTFLLGLLLALVLGGLAFFGVFGEVRGGQSNASQTAAVPNAVGPPSGPSTGADSAGFSGLAAPSSTIDHAPAVDLEGEAVSALEERAGERQSDGAGLQSSFQSAGKNTPARVLGVLQGPAGPVIGAQVVLQWKEPGSEATWVEDTHSDEQGAFGVVTKRLAGDLQLEVRARGYAPYRARVRRLVPGEARNVGTIRLVPGHVLDVDVTDADGRPLAGAVVTLESVGSAGANAFRFESVTASHGRARFQDAPLGTLRVQASAKNNGSRVLIHEHTGSGRPLRLALLLERSLSIRVRSSEGPPISDALVLLTASDQRHESYEINCDSDGLARFEGLGSQLFDARVVAPGFRTDTRRKISADGSEVQFEMLPWPCLSVQVRAPEGLAIPEGTLAWAVPNTTRAAMMRSPSSPNSIAGQAVPVGPDGEVRLCDLRPGEYVVRVDAPGFATTLSESVRITLDNKASLGTLLLQSGGSLKLSVGSQESSQAVSGARVELYVSRPAPAALVNETPAFRTAILRETRSDATGEARFEHLSPGEYTLLLRAPGCQTKLAGPIRVSEGREAKLGKLNLAKGSVLRGLVRRPTGSPVTNAVIVLRGAQANAPVQLGTDEKGEFTSPPLPPGTWKLTARTFGTQSGTTPIERTLVFKAGQDPEPLEFVFGNDGN